jgi:hypothetical protein
MTNQIDNPVAERARAYRNERGHWGSHAEALCNEVDRLQALLTRTLGLITNPVPLMQPVETSRDEMGWLIEVELGGRPHYWKASADARCIGEFDPDANTALRLSREKDARDLALFLSAKGTIALSDVRKIKITEHAWPCSPVEPGAPQTPEQVRSYAPAHEDPGG